jgi:hypothetical protein
VFPRRTRNTHGNEVTNTNISGNLVSNCFAVVPFNKALSRLIIHVFVSIRLVAPDTLALHKSDSPIVAFASPSLTATVPWLPYSVTVSLSCFFLFLEFRSAFPYWLSVTLYYILIGAFNLTSLNPLSSFATKDVTFSTPCFNLCKPPTSVYRAF